MNRRAALGLLGTAPLANAGPDDEGPPADAPRDLKPTGADIGSLFPDVERLVSRNQYPYSFLSGRFASIQEYRKAGREAVEDALGYRPAAVPFAAEVVDRRDLGEFVREKVVFSTTPDFRVPAYVHIPKGLKGRAPAIVDLHSHGGMFLFGKEKVIDFGRNHPVMTEYHKVNYGGRPTATALARRGYVVITIDAFMFGERRLMMDGDLKYGWERSRYSVEDARRLNAICASKEDALAKSLTLAGIAWQGIVLADDRRTVDYLVSRPEVDPDRIGCVGISFGGYRSLFLAAMDDRIAAGCVVGFMSTVKPMARRHIDTHSWVHFVPALHRRLDWPDIVAMRAPKPLLVLQCRRDGLFPLAGMEESVDKIAAIYARAGAPEGFSGRFYDVPHEFNVEMQEDAFRWLDERLKA
ncbi:MAG: prolyl oligopeptidase family serine peptidase [Bryobacteraceae bacterium]|nr:prolyl oligopeptidase family serine peptidase [Bryobacteraceae bacterium]